MVHAPYTIFYKHIVADIKVKSQETITAEP